MVTDFRCKSVKTGIPVLHSEHWHSTMMGQSQIDACINTDDKPFTTHKNLAKFGQVTPEFCWRICTG